jgi:hypothetical protein
MVHVDCQGARKQSGRANAHLCEPPLHVWLDIGGSGPHGKDQCDGSQDAVAVVDSEREEVAWTALRNIIDKGTGCAGAVSIITNCDSGVINGGGRSTNCSDTGQL